MTFRRPIRALAGLAIATIVAVPLAACSDDADAGPQATDKPVVVASTDVWAAVARAVGGDNAEVNALFNTPGGDPHEFEPTTADTAKVLDANVIVMNGGHYDAYMERAAADAKGIKVVALADHEGHDHDHQGHAHEHGDEAAHDHAEGDDHGKQADSHEADDHADHDHAGHNHAEEHAFYNLAIVADTAEDIAEALSKVAPSHAAAYESRATNFRTKVGALQSQLTALRTAHPDTKVAATEPLATGLFRDAGITDLAPAGFTAAVEEGQSPSAADRATFDDLLTGRKVSALIYNVQAVDPATEAVLKTATAAGIPVVRFTETLPEGQTDYVAWQAAQIAELTRALAS